MKSCLKTPPPTPDVSATPTPSGSGRASPTQGECGCERAPTLRKTVSFCDEELEEVHEADEWDRTPAPVTPKLSYQDVLELKQLRLSLPRAPPPPTYRQPFSTSPPPSTHIPFPISRFAAQPSLTPSRWKNRCQNTSPDPEILPYLEAVPIRLLPLLDSQQEPAPTLQPPHPQIVSQRNDPYPSETQSETRPEPTMTTPTLSSCRTLPLSNTHPPTPPTPPSTPPTASPAVSAKTLHNTEPQPSPVSVPMPPPVIHLQSPSATTSSPTPPSPPTPKRRARAFSFVPLLPIEPTPEAPREEVVLQSPPPPHRVLNMTFVPLFAPPSPSPEQQPAPCAQPVEQTDAPPVPIVTLGEPFAQASSQLSSAPVSRPRTIILPPSVMDHNITRSYPRTPVPTPGWFAAASDTDTETEGETDRETETETETESVGTSVSSLPSPPCESNGEACSPDSVLEGVETLRLHEGLRIVEGERMADMGYFPHVPALAIHARTEDRVRSSGPGATPPLDAIFTTSSTASASSAVATSVSGASLASAVSAVALPAAPDAHSSPLRRLAGAALLTSPALRGLPSPALAPPSPFALDAPGLSASLDLGISAAEVAELEQAVAAKRVFVQARTQMRMSVSVEGDLELGSEERGMLRPSLRRADTVRAEHVD
ncbi:hypothetical protein OBBRIDRAFT_822369 [Obba rivulosa]|uniref:Uncharacterized protein n=1 Tax=Obba rivulosa TaxID=1052685 RepID=A0A8E2J7B1_9APHY|nr:hypothetical protein OBBRIDRAFT_822369 [Obba rivulosa]